MSECELKHADAFSSKYIGLQPVGRFIPQCEKDGNYSRIQCWASTGYCWCVDPKTGVEQEETRVRGKPNCPIASMYRLECMLGVGIRGVVNGSGLEGGIV